jgi:hypothetical protein
VVDDELGSPVEEILECCFASVGIEAIFLLDADPGECLPLAGELVASVSQLLLGSEQLKALA